MKQSSIVSELLVGETLRERLDAGAISIRKTVVSVAGTPQIRVRPTLDRQQVVKSVAQ